MDEPLLSLSVLYEWACLSVASLLCTLQLTSCARSLNTRLWPMLCFGALDHTGDFSCGRLYHRTFNLDPKHHQL